MADQLEFKISESLIRPILEAKIHTAVIEALGGQEQLVANMLDAFMKQKVDSNGEAGRGYSSDKPRLEYLATKMMSDALKGALAEYLKTKTDLLQKEFEKFFNSKKGSSELIKAMQEGLLKSLTNDWRFQVYMSKLEDR